MAATAELTAVVPPCSSQPPARMSAASGVQPPRGPGFSRVCAGRPQKPDRVVRVSSSQKGPQPACAAADVPAREAGVHFPRDHRSRRCCVAHAVRNARPRVRCCSPAAGRQRRRGPGEASRAARLHCTSLRLARGPCVVRRDAVERSLFAAPLLHYYRDGKSSGVAGLLRALWANLWRNCLLWACSVATRMVRRVLAPPRYTCVSLPRQTASRPLGSSHVFRVLSGDRRVGCSADFRRRCGRVGQRQAGATPCASTGIKFCAACFRRCVFLAFAAQRCSKDSTISLHTQRGTDRERGSFSPGLTHHNVARRRRQARRRPLSGTRRNQRCAT